MERTPQAMDGAPSGPEARIRIVAIGASAGGLKALQELVAAIPGDSGRAYVVIMHLDPERESRMAELLQDRASIPVSQIGESTEVEADHIYVISPDRDLEMGEGRILVRERGDRAERAPVDLFFRTLALGYGPEAVGVVLSGTGSDGTAGVRSIREAGGVTVAQSPGEADYEGMPASAIATGLVDLVLPASRIPAELLRLDRSPLPVVATERGEALEASLAPVFAALRGGTGHDFSLYRRSSLLRRLERRLLFNGSETLDEYVTLLQSSQAEREALLRDLLISVSSFFRDPEAFDGLAEAVPGLFEGRDPGDTVRVWVVGCASAEEVYSIAMILVEHASTLLNPPGIQMFATDIDERGYAWGREGLYPLAAVAPVSPERLQKFFTKEPGGYRIRKSLREMVLFAVHNVLRDPPFARIDLVSCRNLFIYLQPEAQEQALGTLHYALNPEGLLFLGASESVGEDGLFTPVGPPSHRLFRRTSAPSRVPRLSAADPVGRGAGESRPRSAGAGEFSYGAVHLGMLEEYAEPSAVVDERWEVVHLSERVGGYLRLRAGEPSRRAMNLARGDLRMALRTALHQAFTKGTATTRLVKGEGGGQVVVRVRPGPENGTGSRFALILFEEVDREGEGELEVAPASAESVDGRSAARDLEEELRETREQLEVASASYDHTVAELQAANEELRSINEEQKAAGEELETGREEIQSINEELTTINQEHQSTIEELKRTNGDLQNLIESTEVGTVFVDRNMKIRRFTPAAADLFNFVAADHGRPLDHITHRLHYPNMVADVRLVLESLERIERVVTSESRESYIVRMNPYRSVDGNVDGAVLTFFDHTARHAIEEELREAKAVAEAANAAKTTFMGTLSHELRTPLGAILGYADILQLDGTLSEEQDQRVDRIRAGARHLTGMIDELLSFTRMDVGREVLDRQPVDARAIAGEAHSLMAPAVAAKGLAFQLDLPDQAIPMETDVVKVSQVLMNLCGNAVKYTESGEIGLRVRSAGGRVVFEVVDTGIGIASEHHEKIFERFWQVDGSPTRTSGGLGVGLAAVREYSHLLGGGVSVESRPGEGSTFRFWVPYRRRDEDAPARG